MTSAVAPQIDSLLGPGLTAEQARAIYERGEEAVIFALLELAKHWSQSEGRNASIDSPATPSGMKPVHQKPAAKKSRKKPGRKAGHPGSRRPPPETIDEHKSHRATCCPHCAGRLSRCAQTRVRYIEDIPADVLAGEIERAMGLHLATAGEKPVAGEIVLARDPALTGEAYTLKIGESAVVSGGDYFAVAAGTATLLQSLRSEDGAVSLPRLQVADRPDYAYRGALIDLGRKYHSPSGIKQVIELCRLYKIRYLQLHLTDDQLFMFPSKRFAQVGKGNREFARFEPGSKPAVAPYTLAELEDLEKFSQLRGVHLVPELDMPGHSGRLVGDAPEIFAVPGNGSTVNIASPSTAAALTTLLDEVMDVFRGSPYVHLGADEVGLGGLEQSPDYKTAQQKFGNIHSAHDLYCKFVADMHDVVAKRGKRAIVWEEAWNPAGAYPLPKDTLVMVWSQGRSPAEITRSGYDVVNATWTPLYIVRDNKKSLDFLFHWQAPQFGREGSNTFTTLPPTEKLRGAQLCSWENSEAIEIQSMRDRLALVAEKTWNPRERGGLDEFRARLNSTDALLDKLIHPVAIHVQGKFLSDENTFDEPLTITLTANTLATSTLTAKRPDLQIRYTLDNSLPNADWKSYTGPITVDKTAYLRCGLFDKSGDQQGYLSGSWFRRVMLVKPNLAIGKPVTTGPGPNRDDAWSAAVAVDGRADDVNRHWASSAESPQWLRIDMQKIYPIDSINVITYYDGGRYYQLNAEVSTDGEHWTKVMDLADNKIPATAAGHSAQFAKTNARYVRINMLKNSANPFVHIVEVIVNEAR